MKMKSFFSFILFFIILVLCFHPIVASEVIEGPIWKYNLGDSSYTGKISADGQEVATGGGSTLFLFDRTNSTPVRSTLFASSLLKDVVLSSNGDFIAGITYDIYDFTNNRVFLFSHDNPNPIWNYTANELTRSIDISADGQRILVGFYSGKLFLFNHTDVIPIINKTSSAYYSASISEDGRYVATGSNEGINNCAFYVFNITNLSNIKKLWSFYAPGQALVQDLTPNGEFIVAGETFNGNKTYLFNLTSSQPMWYHEAESTINSVGISSDGQYIVSGSNDCNLYFFQKDSPNPIWNYTAGASVTTVDISNDGQYIVMGSSDDYVYFFNKTNHQPLWKYKTNAGVSSVSIDDEGKYLIANAGNYLYVFNRNGTLILNIPNGNAFKIPGYDLFYFIGFSLVTIMSIYLINNKKKLTKRKLEDTSSFN